MSSAYNKCQNYIPYRWVFFSFVCFTFRGVRERYSFTWKDAVLLLLPVLSDLSLSSPRIKEKLKVLVICVQQLHL